MDIIKRFMDAKKIIIVVGALWFLFFGNCIRGFAQQDIFTIEDEAFVKRFRPHVIFPHQAHTEMKSIKGCNDCHHVFQDGAWVENEDSIGRKCSECHDDEDSGHIFNLIKVYHLQCKGCHLRQKAGPVLCGECHRNN